MKQEHESAVILKPGREKSILRRHPWIFSGAIAETRCDPQAGDTVAVLSSEHELLGRGAFSPHSQIRVRMWTFDPDTAVDDALLNARIRSALELRKRMGQTCQGPADSARLINGESDGIPGLVLDCYGDVRVCQFLSAGAERWRDIISEAIRANLPGLCLYERSDVDVRKKEGLDPKTGVLWGEEPPDRLTILENGLNFSVDVRNGHKTGFYLDQRDNRAVLRSCIPAGADVLNAFSYTGSFSVAALKGGAGKVVSMDSSAPALDLIPANMELNGIDPSNCELLCEDVFTALRRCRDARREFDVVVLDPPKFADSPKHLDKAARAYKDINLLALKLLRPGGLLMTFSCSGNMDAALFQKIVADAALDAGRDVTIDRRLTQSADHTVLLSFPESFYLKGLLCRVGHAGSAEQ